MSDSIYDDATQQVEVDVTVDGTSLGKDYPITKVEVEKKINTVASASITLIDGSPSLGDDSYTAAETFEIGKEVEILAGYNTENESIFKGVITAKNTEQDSNENAVLVIECKDKAIGLLQNKQFRVFSEATDTDMVNGVLADYSVDKSIDISTSVTYDEILKQQNTSDWDFIIKRAQVNSCVVYAYDNKVTVASPKVTEASIRTFTNDSTIKEQSLELSSLEQPKSVKAICWDSAQQKTIEAVAQEPSVNSQGDVSGKDLGSDSKVEHVLKSSVFLEQEALKSWANAYLLLCRLQTINGRLNVQGDPALIPDNIITLEGFGDKYNGDSYIHAVKNTIIPGEWETEVTLGIPQELIDNIEDREEKKYTGLEIGIVKQIQEDPNKQFRVLVDVPCLTELKDGIWARYATPYATKEKGFCFYPEVGDEVVLGFLEGNASAPIIIGSLFSKENTPPNTPDEKNTIKSIVSKEDIKIEFNDEKKILTITTPKENKIVLSDEDEEISIADSNDNTITMNKDGITIKTKGELSFQADNDITFKGAGISMSADQDVEAKGMNVNMTAQSSMGLKASASAELTADGKVAVKGATLALN